MPKIGRSLRAHAVLFDTGAYVALADADDESHDIAQAYLQTITDQRLPFFTTSPVIYESHRLLLHGLGIKPARRFLATVISSPVTVIRPHDAHEQTARSLLYRYRDVKLTLTDAVSMAVMMDLGIANAFSFDDDFTIAGLIRVPELLRPR
jgi:predicted nucleic acid-binding protein